MRSWKVGRRCCYGVRSNSKLNQPRESECEDAENSAGWTLSNSSALTAKRPTEIPAGLVRHEGGAEARLLRWQAAKGLYWCEDYTILQLHVTCLSKWSRRTAAVKELI